MHILLQRLRLSERGSIIIEWVGVSAAVFVMVIGIWMAFYGPPGQALKQVIEVQITCYARGFEGGLSTTGPVGGMPDRDAGADKPFPDESRAALQQRDQPDQAGCRHLTINEQ
jgi:hypothetical protein